MSPIINGQTELFGAPPALYEYYPVLVPDEAGMKNIVELHRLLVENGIRASQLTKLPHISIDGVICPENDDKVIQDVSAFLSRHSPIHISFSDLGYFGSRNGLVIKLGIENAESVIDFNKVFMEAIHGKVTKLNLHLTLARYVSSDVYDRIKSWGLSLPDCFCGEVAIYKKPYKVKTSYDVIRRIGFGTTF